MPRTVRDAKLDSRAARTKLPAQNEPHWRAIDQGAHLGYYKGVRGGAWFARYRGPESTGYKKRKLGRADDIQDANGVDVLSFSQAQEKAREWFTARARHDAGMEPETGPYSVGDAIRDYIDEYYAVHGKSLKDTNYRINAFILPELGALEVEKLTTQRLRKWLAEISASPPRLRTRKGHEQRYGAPTADPDAVRKRRNSANKVLMILKAALNFSWQEGRVRDAESWRRVKPYRDVDAPRIRFLTDIEIRRLTNASDPEFRPMVQAALLTGCRYGELTRLRAVDIDLSVGNLHVRESKSGKPRDIVLTDEGRQFFRQTTASKADREIVFSRSDGAAWGKSHQSRLMVTACENAKISPAISFHILRHCYASRLARAGTPLTVIARQLGHADTRICERHYAHLSPSYVADTVRANFSTLGIVEEDQKVVPFGKGTGAG